MPDQQRGIQNFKKFSDVEYSVSDFKKAYDLGVRGLTDIDAAYEKNGYIVWLEGKWVQSNYLDIPVSQAQTLFSFKQKKGCSSFVVAHKRTDNGVAYWICGIEYFLNNARLGKPDGTTILRVNLDKIRGPFNTNDFWKLVKSILDPLENYKSIDAKSVLNGWSFPPL